MSEAATSLPPEEHSGNRLKPSVEARCARHPGMSGIHPLNDGLDAFAARYQLMSMAQHTIDVQYYIWHNDMSGRLLFSALLDAAERGVKVRLLLDDNNTPFYGILLVVLGMVTYIPAISLWLPRMLGMQ